MVAANAYATANLDPPFQQRGGFFIFTHKNQEEERMNSSVDGVKRNKVWHIPASIATLAMGIYLALVYFVPSFAPEYHEVVMAGNATKIIPYALLLLIGSPVFSLWHYVKLDTDPEFVERNYE